MNPKRVLLLVFGLCAFLFMRAEAYTLETMPSPKEKGQDFYVSNPDAVITPETEKQLNELCTRLEKNTEVELAVVVVKDFDTPYTTYSFARDLFNHWGIGKADKNNGVLLFLSSERRDIQIITGKGVEGILTDSKSGEILDDNFEWLSNNDFDNGLLHICLDIEELMMNDSSRAELLLGWKPESPRKWLWIVLYLWLGFIVAILMARYCFQRIQGKPGQSQKEIQDQSSNAKSATGCLSFIFPIPMLFLYIYYIIARKRVQAIPFTCSKCGRVMEPVDKNDPRRVLTAEQKKEEELQSREYEIWVCPDCGTTQSKQHKGKKYYYYTQCPQCKAEAMKTESSTTVTKATSYSNGLRKDTNVCLCCGYKMIKDVVLPALTTSSSYSGSSGSWGGGSSSGSWGGGRSSGGGAGRHF